MLQFVLFHRYENRITAPMLGSLVFDHVYWKETKQKNNNKKTKKYTITYNDRIKIQPHPTSPTLTSHILTLTLALTLILILLWSAFCKEDRLYGVCLYDEVDGKM